MQMEYRRVFIKNSFQGSTLGPRFCFLPGNIDPWMALGSAEICCANVFRDEVSSEPDNDTLLRFRLGAGSFGF